MTLNSRPESSLEKNEQPEGCKEDLENRSCQNNPGLPEAVKLSELQNLRKLELPKALGLEC